MQVKQGVFIICLFLIFKNAPAQERPLSADQELARSIFKELIEINTTHATGNTTIAAEALAKRLINAGHYCCYHTWMSWKQNGQTGPWILLYSQKKMNELQLKIFTTDSNMSMN